MVVRKKISQLTKTLPNVVCRGYVPLIENAPHVIYAFGGIGKSYVSLRLAIVYLMENKTKRALVWLSEDPEGETSYRIREICKSLGLDTHEIEDRLDVVDQQPIRFTTMAGSNCVASPEFFELRKQFLDIDLLVLDPLLQFQGGDENSNSHAGIWTGLVKDWCKQSNMTMVIIHHATTQADGSLKARGARDWVNGVRGAYEVNKVWIADDKGKLTEDETMSSYRNIFLRKENGLGRFVRHEKGDLSFDVPVFPTNNTIFHQDANGRYTTSYEVPTAEVIDYQDDSISMPVMEEEPKVRTVHISLATHNVTTRADGYNWKEIPFSELDEFMTYGMNYSPIKFKDGYRKTENYEGGTDVIFLDIDNGMTIEDAKVKFASFDAIISTTKSHRKDKGGIVCDRFRVAIPLDDPINEDASKYREIMADVFNHFGSVDPATKDPARFFYSSPTNGEVYFINGGNALNWKDIHYKANQLRVIEEAERRSRAYENNTINTDATTEDATRAILKIDPDCDYNVWFEIGMALKNEFGDNGFSIWDSWSSRGSKYPGEKSMRTKWATFKGSGISIGTLFYYAK